VRLVLADLMMPEVDGRELGEAIASRDPDLPILYMSAYAEDEIARRRLLQPSVPFLQKPFSPSQLARSVRAALD
jgi:two-component system cell cycle sensor histidine kinase/response regulator CckA